MENLFNLNNQSMETKPATTNTAVAKNTTVKTLFQQQNIKARFEEMMGKRASQFITSVLQISATNLPSDVEPFSVYNAAAVAATLDLPLNNNLGFAYIVAYNEKYQDQADGQWKKRPVAQFQMGYKGFIQLAQRSGQFKTISATPIFKGQLVSQNPLTGFEFDFMKKESEEVIGYAAYFKLLNGFEKTFFMSMDQIKSHGKKYSQTFSHKNGRWENDFDSMATKTVLKLLLSKFAPLSVEMQTAIKVDQAVITNDTGTEVTYVDAIEIPAVSVTQSKEEIEEDRMKQLISDCVTLDDLALLQEANPGVDIALFNAKKDLIIASSTPPASETKDTTKPSSKK